MLSGALLSDSLRRAEWRITQVESRQPIVLADVARAEAGYIEKVWDKMAVITPDHYFVSLTPNTIASITPANHQKIVRWVRAPRNTEGLGLESARLKGLVNNLGTRSHIVMGLDVEDQRTATEVRRSLELAPVPGLDARADLDLLATTLAGIKTVVLSAQATDGFAVDVQIEMTSNPEWMASYAKPLAVEYASRLGLNIPELQDWSVSVEGNTLHFTGSISSASMEELLSTVGVRTIRPAAPISDDPEVIAETSRRFYRSLVQSLNSFPRPLSYPRAIAWANRQAAMIEQLPLTNVDPALIAWSNEISHRLREMIQELGADMLSNQADQAGVQRDRSYGYSAYAYSGYYGYDGALRAWGYHGTNNAAVAAQRAADAERAQRMRQNQAESVRKVTQIMEGVNARRNAIRAAMVEKYGIEF